jgi:aspartyl-tRNA(Asn)/glutamyl-tRNA(Gln) amidotransferase subunit A
MGTLALCTDGGGSIRNPAAFTGLCGLKPSFGRVPVAPPSPMGTLANSGPIARSVADVALMLNTISRPDARDWLALPYDPRDYRANLNDGIKGKRVAFSPALGFALVDPEVAKLVAAAARSFADDLGAHVEEVDPPIGSVKALFDTHWHVGTAAAFALVPPDRLSLLDPGLDRFVELGKRVALLDYVAASVKRAQLGQKMREFHERYELLLVPTVSVPAFPADRRDPPGVAEDDWEKWTPFSYPFNMTMQPAMSVPCGFTRAGLPVGLQIVGGMYQDALVLAAAAAFERAHPEHTRRPAV